MKSMRIFTYFALIMILTTVCVLPVHAIGIFA